MIIIISLTMPQISREFLSPHMGRRKQALCPSGATFFQRPGLWYHKICNVGLPILCQASKKNLQYFKFLTYHFSTLVSMGNVLANVLRRQGKCSFFGTFLSS